MLEDSRVNPDVSRPASRCRALLAALVVCALGIAVVALVSFHVARATRFDAEGYDGFLLLQNVTVAGLDVFTVAQDAVNSGAEIKKLIDQLKKAGKKSVLLLVYNADCELRFCELNLH